MEELVLQYNYLSTFILYFGEKMEILKEYHYLYQHYYETCNSCLNICQLKIVVLLSNHENHLQTNRLFTQK